MEDLIGLPQISQIFADYFNIYQNKNLRKSATSAGDGIMMQPHREA